MEIKRYFFGFSRWKKNYIKPFFIKNNNDKIYFCKSLQEAVKKGLDKNSIIYIWGITKVKSLKEFAKQNNIVIYKVEDGFIRSVSLGVDFSKPYSLVVDKKGIYYDATKVSDLEYILQNYEFTNNLLKRGKRVKEYLIKNKLSKYNIFFSKNIILPNVKKNQKVILVIGQVEEDASLVYGANNMKNIELLKKVREDFPNDYLIYKPHPDVISGKRKGIISKHEVLKYVNLIEEKVDIDSLFNVTNKVATMTSLVGFEALLREKEVICYGIPFYAGWGLTIDRQTCKRRTRKLTLEELIVGAYILYPLYIDPITMKRCEIERVLDILSKEKDLYHNFLLYRIKTKIKNFITIKYYAILRHLLKD